MNQETMRSAIEDLELSLVPSLRSVNVATVPQRSPWRYPGGKTWLVPYIRQWLSSLSPKPVRLAEPFVGGGTISLTAAFEYLTEQGATMVELDCEVAATWQTILHGKAQWLADRVLSFEMTPANVKAQMELLHPPLHEIGFTTLLRNRISHGGVLAAGAGILKNGEGGKGIKSRWYPETLKKRILDIAGHSDRLEFLEGDGLEYMRENAHRPELVWFIDPPYTAGNGKRAGKRLYRHCTLNHEGLFSIAERLTGDFLMTYDDAFEVRELAASHGFDLEAITMKGTHLSERKELLIGRNLSWVRKAR